MKQSQTVFTPAKVDYEHEKIEQYLAGRPIYPSTIELDLTQLCSRACPGCPYGATRTPGLTLQLPFLDRLFSILGPHTPGIVFSGGEPTIVPHFPETVRLARQKGFKEIAVISNGANIDKPHIQDALMQDVTVIRISQYEWQTGETAHFRQTLGKIETLRSRIEQTGSKLEIGASMLTRTEVNHRYRPVGRQVLDAGVHWLYFHPYCIDWDKLRPCQADQTGVLEALRQFRQSDDHANIQIPYARYAPEPLSFTRLHGAHFLIQVGADGVNYAGPECKYEPDFALVDLNGQMREDFLWDPRRIAKLDQITSDNYRYIATKHRPPMFSDYVQRIIDQRQGVVRAEPAAQRSVEFAYPNII
jgi:hypothetical protein